MKYALAVVELASADFDLIVSMRMSDMRIDK